MSQDKSEEDWKTVLDTIKNIHHSIEQEITRANTRILGLLACIISMLALISTITYWALEHGIITNILDSWISLIGLFIMGFSVLYFLGGAIASVVGAMPSAILAIGPNPDDIVNLNLRSPSLIKEIIQSYQLSIKINLLQSLNARYHIDEAITRIIWFFLSLLLGIYLYKFPIITANDVFSSIIIMIFFFIAYIIWNHFYKIKRKTIDNEMLQIRNQLRIIVQKQPYLKKDLNNIIRYFEPVSIKKMQRLLASFKRGIVDEKLENDQTKVHTIVLKDMFPSQGSDDNLEK
ncbi:MAG: hypothetical protein HZB92_06460 [Euryarchaeota archaeon]|nr:hypothetical protein [Euryarchaeota archaeon]